MDVNRVYNCGNFSKDKYSGRKAKSIKIILILPKLGIFIVKTKVKIKTIKFAIIREYVIIHFLRYAINNVPTIIIIEINDIISIECIMIFIIFSSNEN